MKKIFLILPIAIWITLGYTDVLSYFFQMPKPMFFRAWEYVLNEGKDSFYVPFKPHASYQGVMTGDLLNYVQFTPKKTEIRKEVFLVDEYGFRNPLGMLKKPIFAVMTGTSFVGGAQETQSNTITQLLSEKYHIPTYNYATLPLQFLWEDQRFLANKPRYIFVVGNESEIMQDGWIEVLKDSDALRTIPAYGSYKMWDKANKIPANTFLRLSQDTKRFSLIRYLFKLAKLNVLNTLLPRSLVFALSDAQNVKYDNKRDIIFSDKAVFDPKINTLNAARINKTIQTLLTTKEVLAKRNIKLLVVPVPSKSHMHSEEYMDLPENEQALLILEKALVKNNINFVDVYYPMKEFLKNNPNKLLYYADDGHWNTNTNIIIARQINDKIKAEIIVTHE